MSALISSDLEQQAIAWRRHLHANPELSFHEVETSRFVEETLSSFDGLELSRPTPTAVVATLRGSRPGKVLALRVDMDALPIQEETGLEFASTRPGVMHACGHDCHTAILLGAAKTLAGRRDEFAGEVRFVFRNFPITTSHPHAEQAAEAAEAAAAQGRFWEMHDYLYEHQRNLTDADLHQYAQQLGLDVDRFDGELAQHIGEARVREDFMSGVRSGVNGTPTFYIDGKRHDGSYELEALLAALESPSREER